MREYCEKEGLCYTEELNEKLYLQVNAILGRGHNPDEEAEREARLKQSIANKWKDKYEPIL